MTPAAPMVTVAMVTHDSARFVVDAIGSVLAQDFRDFELLICDDCSQDRTWQLASRFRDDRIRAVRNERKVGEYANRNQAVRMARGEFVIFVDGDDYLYPHGLSVMVKALRAFPDAAFAAAQQPSEKFIFPVELAPHEYLSCQFLGPRITGKDFTQVLFRTACLRACGGFDERIRTGDTHLQLLLGARYNSVLAPAGNAWWRRHPGQASEKLLDERWGVAEFTRYARELVDDPQCPLAATERSIARANIARAMMRSVARFVLRGRWVHALRLFRASGLALPDARHLFARERRPFLEDVGGANPLGPNRRASALPPPVARVAVDRKDRLGDAFARAEVVDRAAARRDEVPVVEDHVAADR